MELCNAWMELGGIKDFARDIERHLERLPEGEAEHTRYRTSKFVPRHKIEVGSTSALAAPPKLKRLLASAGAGQSRGRASHGNRVTLFLCYEKSSA